MSRERSFAKALALFASQRAWRILSALAHINEFAHRTTSRLMRFCRHSLQLPFHPATMLIGLRPPRMGTTAPSATAFAAMKLPQHYGL
jgi:hypothetical protein